MIPSPELPPRPAPSRGPVVAIVEWARWIGPARLALSALSTAVVVVGALWLVRSPDPSAESVLPHVSTSSTPTGSVAVATLAPPASPSTSIASPASTTLPTEMVVHVAGAVARPGVLVVVAGARVGDAVDAAGGATADAELDGLNLAAPLADGQRIYVPYLGEVDPASLPSAVAPVGSGPAVVPAGPVDLNTATAAELEALPGIGPATAAAIIDDRARNGPFATVDDLDRVSGIGPAKLAGLRDQVTV